MAAGITLLGGFQLKINNEAVELNPGPARLVAAIALFGAEPVDREVLGAILWPRNARPRRLANVRCALSRLPPLAQGALAITEGQLGAAAGTAVDVQQLGAVAADGVDLEDLSAPLLPGWYDDWVVMERDRIANVQIALLEARSERLLRQGRYGHAIESAFASILIEPLREAPHRLVIRCHIAEGNVAEARAHLEFARDLFYRELDAAFSANTHDLLQSGE